MIADFGMYFKAFIRAMKKGRQSRTKAPGPVAVNSEARMHELGRGPLSKLERSVLASI